MAQVNMELKEVYRYMHALEEGYRLCSEIIAGYISGHASADMTIQIEMEERSGSLGAGRTDDGSLFARNAATDGRDLCIPGTNCDGRFDEIKQLVEAIQRGSRNGNAILDEVVVTLAADDTISFMPSTTPGDVLKRLLPPV